MAKRVYKTKKTPELCDRIFEFVREENPTRNRIARRFKVSASTISSWLYGDPKFREKYDAAVSYFINSAKADAKASLKKLVTGYDYEEERVEFVDNGMGEPIAAKKIVIKKHMPPNIQAIMFVLRNVEPENFD